MTIQTNQAEFVLTLHELVKFQVILQWRDDLTGYEVLEVNGQIRVGLEGQVEWIAVNTFHTPETFTMLQDELCDLIDTQLMQEAVIARRAKKVCASLSVVK